VRHGGVMVAHSGMGGDSAVALEAQGRAGADLIRNSAAAVVGGAFPSRRGLPDYCLLSGKFDEGPTS